MMRRLLLAASLLLVCLPARAAFETGDLICQQTTTTGTGTLTLGAAVSNYVTFVSQITSLAQVPYHIIASDGKLETGIGVFTDAASDTLSRVADWSTDGSGAELTLPAGTHTVCLGPISTMFFNGAGLSTPAASLAFQVDSDGTPLSILTLESTASILGFATVVNNFTTTSGPYPVTQFQHNTDGADGAFFGSYHNSASAAASDDIGGTYFMANDDAGNRTAYGTFEVEIVDPANGSEDSRFYFKTAVAGAEFTTQMIASNGVTIGSTDLAPGAGNLAFGDAKGIFDNNANEQLIFQTTASAVNYLEVTNSATATYPQLSAAGSDSNVGINMAVQGGPADNGSLGNAMAFNLGTGSYGGLTFYNTDAGTGGPFMVTVQNSASPAANDDTGGFSHRGKDAAGNYANYAGWGAKIIDTTNGSEDGSLSFSTAVAGTEYVPQLWLSNGVSIGATDLLPGAGNLGMSGTALGTTATSLTVTLDTDGTPLQALRLGSAILGTSGSSLDLGSGSTAYSTIYSSNDGSNGGILALFHQSPTPATNDLVGGIAFWGINDAAAAVGLGGLGMTITDLAAASIDSRLGFNTKVAGADVTALILSNGVSIGASDLTPGAGNLGIGGSGCIEFNGGTDTTLCDNGAAELTLEGDAVKHAGLQSLYIPASAMKSSVLNPASCGDTYDSGSNDLTISVCAFDPGATEEKAEFGFQMPKSWNESTITFAPISTCAGACAAAETLQYELACASISDSDTMNSAQGSAASSSKTLQATPTNELLQGATSSAITIANTPNEVDYVHCRISRDTSVDNMAGDALLIGVRIFWSDNASTMAE